MLNKVDLPSADPERVCKEIEDVVGIDCTGALLCSAKTGQGVPEIIKSIIATVPPPQQGEEAMRASGCRETGVGGAGELDRRA